MTFSFNYTREEDYQYDTLPSRDSKRLKTYRAEHRAAKKFRMTEKMDYVDVNDAFQFTRDIVESPLFIETFGVPLDTAKRLELRSHSGRNGISSCWGSRKIRYYVNSYGLVNYRTIMHEIAHYATPPHYVGHHWPFRAALLFIEDNWGSSKYAKILHDEFVLGGLELSPGTKASVERTPIPYRI